MYFMIDATPEDTSAMLVKQRLEAMKQRVHLIETMKFPRAVKLAYDPEDPMGGMLQVTPGGEWLPLGELKGVFRRGSKWIQTPLATDFMEAELIYWNIESALGSLYRLINCRWVNPLDCTKNHKHKSRELNIMAGLGVRIPHTLVTNSHAHVLDVFDQLEGKAVLKYPQGGVNTKRLTRDFIESDEFKRQLPHVPVKIQECIEGVDIRVYVMDEDVFALEIHGENIDFRETPLAHRKPIELPPEIQAQCLAVRKHFGMAWTGIDMKRTAEGEHVFFEANPTPIFLYDEIATGYPLSQRIADYLVA